MRKFLVLALCTAATLPALAKGTVEVSYVQPEKFTDIGFSTWDRESALRQMTGVLQEFAARLPDGQTLRFEVTDIDLAGELRQRRTGEVRVLRGMTDWPVVNLRYTLQAGATTLKSGEARVYEMDYQHGTKMLDGVGTNLPHERRMLQKWFTATFATPEH